MKEYAVYPLFLKLQWLDTIHKTLTLSDTVSNSSPEGSTENIANLFDELRPLCEELFADSTLIESLVRLARAFREEGCDKRPAALVAHVEGVLNGIHHNLEKRKFLILSEEDTNFYGNFNVFGESFKEKYSIGGLVDAVHASRAYAFGLYTASVFHSMRVAEYGLRKLAANNMLRVKLTDRGKSMPIEYATWNKVITQIRNKITKIRQRADGPKKESDLQFFSSAADHCEYMKDIWRNEISHTRRSYQKEEALSVINRVREFVTVIGEHKGSIPAQDSVQRLLNPPPPPPKLSLRSALSSLENSSSETA